MVSQVGYGFASYGTKGNLVLSDQSPILTAAYKGKLVVTDKATAIPSGVGYGYGYCNVVYPTPVYSSIPPMVFGVPTETANQAGLALFCHRGKPGAWTGFSVMIGCDINLMSTQAMTVGFDSGWEYHVCGFGLSGQYGMDQYGLRIWDALGDIIYDSAWPVVKFQGLMAAWTHTGFTRAYATGAYWEPNSNYDEHGVDYDYVLAQGQHTWGHANRTKGVMISSLGLTNFLVDFGANNRNVSAVTFIGFSGAGRTVLKATAVVGKAQHPGGDLSNMRRWNMLTADFTGL